MGALIPVPNFVARVQNVFLVCTKRFELEVGTPPHPRKEDVG